MNRSRIRKTAVAALAVGLLAVLGVAATPHHHHHPAPVPGPKPAPARSDRDKASDCWTRPDSHGHRHCA